MDIGRHLWKVELYKPNVKLLVVTDKKNVALAAKAAQRFINQSDEYRGAVIEGIEYDGTIDAWPSEKKA